MRFYCLVFTAAWEFRVAPSIGLGRTFPAALSLSASSMLLLMPGVLSLVSLRGLSLVPSCSFSTCYTGFSLASGGADQRRAVSKMACCVRDLRRWFDANRLRNNFSKLFSMYVTSSTPFTLSLESLPLVFEGDYLLPIRHCDEPWSRH